MSVRIHVFGRLRVDDGDVVLSSRGFDGRKPRQVLQILAAHHGRAVSKDRLADLLWCDEPPADPDGSVEHYVAVLRRRLRRPGRDEPSLVQTDASGYRLDVDSAWLDLAAFRGAAADLATWLHLDRVRDALRLSEAEPFADEPDSAWAMDVRREVSGRRSDLLVRAAELGLVDGDPLSAARDAADAIVLEPHLESAHRALIAAHYVHGDQARALTAYRSLRDRLVAELGVEPTPHTRALHDAILHHSRTDEVLRRLTVPQGLRSA
jgi:DNA-binding SARP family transcriptional activator